MARNGSFRWRGWPSNTSKHNPYGVQRECSRCGKPFVPSSDRVARCPRCLATPEKAKQPAAGGHKKDRHRNRKPGENGRQPAKQPQPAQNAGQDTLPPPELMSKKLKDIRWPPSATELTLTFAAEADEVYLRWPACGGKATIQAYGADGKRLHLSRLKARKGAATISKLPEGQRLTVLIFISTGPKSVTGHARITVVPGA